MVAIAPAPSREHLLHALYEAAELEHNLMCTYLYAAFSLRHGEHEGLTAEESAAVARWRQAMIQVAVDEMGHLVAVWNITSALGGSPRFGRNNFPLDPGLLPAGIVVKLAPFCEASLQHFVHLERPAQSHEPEGAGFEPLVQFDRGNPVTRLTPMAVNYDTVGVFYHTLEAELQRFSEAHGERIAFCGDPELQLSEKLVTLVGARQVRCLNTALVALNTIVEQGEGAPEHSAGSHFQTFTAIRDEFAALKAKRPSFDPAFPSATNPVLRRPWLDQRVWIENEDASITVDLANAAYATMLRLLAYSYLVVDSSPEKQLVVDLSLALMHAITPLAERAARLPAGPSNPVANAGITFTTLRDSAPLPPGRAARQFFVERLHELATAATKLADNGDAQVASAARVLQDIAGRAERRFASFPPPQSQSESTHVSMTQPTNRPPAQTSGPAAATGAPPIPTVVDGVDHVEGKKLTLLFESQRCIHARFCVTGAPSVFIANIEGPWINPDTVPVERLVEIAHACPSGAIRYERKDGHVDEQAPPVNLISIREAGPYAVKADLDLDGKTGEFRATLCRCGASKNKPYCDGSHHEIGFDATGEPASGKTDMLETRDGRLTVEPLVDGPLRVRGNVEITSGTGRVVARVTQAALCRCGGSKNKPFCDGSHVQNGFRS